jgi:hypothetical protein
LKLAADRGGAAFAAFLRYATLVSGFTAPFTLLLALIWVAFETAG